MSRVLVLSFSDISSDARVRKQVKLLSPHHEIITLGFGPTPDGSSLHIPIEPSPETRTRAYVRAFRQRLGRYDALARRDPLVRDARLALDAAGIGTPDAVVANDIDTVPLAVERWPGRVHADLHEYFPGIHDDVPAWVRWRQPYYRHLLTRYATRARSATTVSQGIAERYTREYGFPCQVVPNASPFHELAPTAVGSPIRLVHSGVAQPGRRLELTMRAAAAAGDHVTLDLFLMPSDVAYLARLDELARELGPRIRVRSPLSQSELIPTLNGYDLGVFVLPPTTSNNALALPNKFFDFVQARIGTLIGPSPAMAPLVDEYGIGVVLDDFDEETLARALTALDAARIRDWKAAAHAAARELSGESLSDPWIESVRAIVDDTTG